MGISAGVAAAVAATAGAYWLYGAKHSAQHRRIAKSWMLKARAEVLEAVEKIQDIDKESYMRVVENVLKSYSKKAGTTTAEMSQMMRDFKAAWVHMHVAQKKALSGTNKVSRTGKKLVRKAKKAVSK